METIRRNILFIILCAVAILWLSACLSSADLLLASTEGTLILEPVEPLYMESCLELEGLPVWVYEEVPRVEGRPAVIVIDSVWYRVVRESEIGRGFEVSA